MAQIAFKNYRLFFDEKENHDLIAYYSVTGGVPKYIELFKPMPDIFEAIKTNILSKQCFLYEDICRERLSEMISRGFPDFILSKAGRWWDKNTEIDIVALDPQGSAILFGECKYSSGKIDPSVYYHLKEKSEKVPCKKEAQKLYVLFSRSGFSRELIELAEKEKGLVLYHFNG